MTEYRVHGTEPRVGRKKLWAEHVNLSLPEGAKARMDAVLGPDEDRLDLIRGAIEAEVVKRERAQVAATIKSPPAPHRPPPKPKPSPAKPAPKAAPKAAPNPVADTKPLAKPTRWSGLKPGK